MERLIFSFKGITITVENINGVKSMTTVSLCMIVKDEEKVLERCLNSVSDLVDEIIIVDTGSKDNTKKIAKKYTDKIFDFQWIDDFSSARNFSFSKAEMDYIFWLDADDVLEEEDRVKFSKLKEELDNTADSVTMKYNLAFDEDGNLSFSLRRNRLVKRTNSFKWIGAVHEYLQVWGNIQHSDVAVTHKSIHESGDRNLKIYEKRLEKGEEFSPRDLYYFGNELLDHQFYERAAVFYEKFLTDGRGWVEDNIACCRKLAYCYKYMNDSDREMQAILRSFRYASPRSEFCYWLGNYFLEKQDIMSAIFWYRLATQIKQDDTLMSFYNPAFSTWMPHLQLCVCYDRIGNHRLAYLYNEVARQYKPNDSNILKNQAYFYSILGQEAIDELMSSIIN